MIPISVNGREKIDVIDIPMVLCNILIFSPTVVPIIGVGILFRTVYLDSINFDLVNSGGLIVTFPD